jgi:hypothetical protein
MGGATAWEGEARGVQEDRGSPWVRRRARFGRRMAGSDEFGGSELGCLWGNRRWRRQLEAPRSNSFDGEAVGGDADLLSMSGQHGGARNSVLGGGHGGQGRLLGGVHGERGIASQGERKEWGGIMTCSSVSRGFTSVARTASRRWLHRSPRASTQELASWRKRTRPLCIKPPGFGVFWEILK